MAIINECSPTKEGTLKPKQFMPCLQAPVSSSELWGMFCMESAVQTLFSTVIFVIFTILGFVLANCTSAYHSCCGHLECWTHHMKPRDCDIKESVLVVEAVEGVVALHVSRGCGKCGTAGVLVDFPWADNWELSCG